MTSLPLDQRRLQRRTLGNWILATLLVTACGDPRETTVPSYASPTEEPSTPDPAAGEADGNTSGAEATSSPAGETPEATSSESGAATPEAASEGVDDEIDLASDEPRDVASGEGQDPASEPPEGSADGQEEVTEEPPPPPVPAIEPPGYPAGSAPRLVPVQFAGPISGRPVPFNVYLPPGYESGTAPYPVLYDLHGLTDSRDTNPGPVIRSLEAAMRNGVVGPLIVIFPQSFVEAYYADARDGVRPSETQIMRELIPYVDQNFRTLAHRARRGVSGFSMGGFGALAYAVKYPDRFSVGIGYDSALDTWETLVGRRAYIATAAFGNDESYFDQISPWANAERNAAVLTESSSLRVVPGNQYREFNEAFRTHLTSLGIPHGFAQTDCPHDYNCVIDREGEGSWAMIQAAFSRPAIANEP